jgi:acyl-CoA thioesterase-1
MSASRLPLLIGLFLLLASGARAADTTEACPVPPEFALTDLKLPAAKAEVAAHKRLAILVIGGAASAGTPAHGPGFTYPTRLETHLRDKLPDVEISVMMRAAPRRTTRVTVDRLPVDLDESGAQLVIWGAGAMEAGQRTDPELLARELTAGIDRVAAAHVDLVLLDIQYAPNIARRVDLTPYRDITRSTGAAHGVVVFDRYDLMRLWNENGTLNLDATDPKERLGVARRLYDCLADTLASAIAAAVR